MAATRDNRLLFVTGHGEYDTATLDNEYKRDKASGVDTALPENYYRDNDPSRNIAVRWKAHSNLFFSNWLNYCVYQETPYHLEDITEKVL